MEAAMIKACIFDLDGTLTNTLDSLEYSVNETMKEIGMPQITKEQCRQFVGDGAKVLLERCLLYTSDMNGLLKWLGAFKEAPQRVFVVHGEDTVTEEFAKTVEEKFGYQAYAPFPCSEDVYKRQSRDWLQFLEWQECYGSRELIITDGFHLLCQDIWLQSVYPLLSWHSEKNITDPKDGCLWVRFLFSLQNLLK